MIPKTFIATITICLCSFFAFSQNTKAYNAKSNEISKFIILGATKNDHDLTDYYLDQSAYIVFYSYDNDDLIYMSNYCEKDNTQSYGPMHSTNSLRNEETIETFESTDFNFTWRYVNTYDGKTGTAKVLFTKIRKANGVSFILKIIPENLDVIIFTGYMEGSIDY